MKDPVIETLQILERHGFLDPEISPVISDEALASCRRMLTDEYLDYMGYRYRRLAIRFWTGAEFHQYLLHPEALDAEADRKRGYVAFRVLHPGGDSVVATTN